MRRGAGLALQRTYNSQDDRPGPFGVGWPHAYDIRMEQENPTTKETSDTLNVADRTDFFGAKHKYHRDCDGLYSVPGAYAILLQYQPEERRKTPAMTLESLTKMYSETIKPLPARDRLLLARWILDDIPAHTVVDDSDDWSEEDMRDATRYSMRRVAALFEEETEDAHPR